MAENDCVNPEQHCDLHACQLKPTTLNDETNKIFDDPRYVCTNCGARVHNEENLCKPRPI